MHLLSLHVFPNDLQRLATVADTRQFFFFVVSFGSMNDAFLSPGICLSFSVWLLFSSSDRRHGMYSVQLYCTPDFQ